MHHSQETTDTALDWCIELISQSNVLEVDAKYAILDALKDKISSGEFSPTTRVSTRGRRAFAPVSRIAPRSASSLSPIPVTPPASLQIRMYVESISRLTASEESGPFMRLRPENVNEVFQSLVKMGDVAHALGDDSIPMPTITLTAQTYAETMLTHLRPPYRDVDNFAESVDAYDLDDDDFRSASPWLDVDALENIRVDLKKQAARVTPIIARCDGILRRWNTAKDTLVELAKFCGEILEAMGPSFLERVAADFRSGRYAPPSADGVLIPQDALDPPQDDARAERRERELLEAGRVLREALDKDRPSGGASPRDLKNKRKAAPPATRRDDDVEAAAVRRNVTAFEKLKAANEAVADPLKEALRASDAAGGRGGGKGGKKTEEATWNALAAEYEAESDESDESDKESNESDESPAARAAKARRASSSDGRRKMPIIRPHDRGATARTVRWDGKGGNVSDVSTPPTTKKANGPIGGVIGARTTRVGTSGRKAYTRWTRAQEEELRRLVGVYGVGSWATILEAGRDRTSVNLKDKWRVLTKAR